MGRYRPPSDLDPSLASTTSKPPRWQKPAQNTIRFELPVPIWCSTCPDASVDKLIAAGIRFNAEKKRVGNYFSTPVFAFKIKHTACGGWIEIRNDPKKAREAAEGKADKADAWIVTEGARKREYGEIGVKAEEQEGTVLWQPRDPKGGLTEEKFEAREQVLADFEKRKQNKEINVDRVAELKVASDRFGRDPDAWNKKLRKHLRDEKKRDEEESRSLGPQSKVSKRVKSEQIGKMVRDNTREVMLSSVWDGSGNATLDLGLKVRPVKSEGRHRDEEVSSRINLGRQNHDRYLDRSNEKPLVAYQEDDWYRCPPRNPLFVSLCAF